MIRENDSGVFISGVQEVQVKKMEDCLQLLQLGERNRVFAFTELNAHSSRSHAIVLLTIVKRKKVIRESPSPEDLKVRRRALNDQNHIIRLHSALILVYLVLRWHLLGFLQVKVGKLFIVDLAGSERLKKSRSEGLRKREAKSINLSLTTLGMCINARADPNAQHVPFRDSKLTRLLQVLLMGPTLVVPKLWVGLAEIHLQILVVNARLLF